MPFYRKTLKKRCVFLQGMGDENPESEHQADDVHLIEVSKQASFYDAIFDSENLTFAKTGSGQT
jgi:hypothetical protein